MSQYSASISAGYTKHVEAFASRRAIAPKRYGSGQANVVPDRAFNTSSSPIAVSAPTDAIWKRLCGAAAIEHLADLSMTERVTQRDAIDAQLAAVFATKPAGEWAIVLTQARVPHALVATKGTTGEILRQDLQVKAGKLIRTLPTTRGELCVSSPPWTFSRTPAGIGCRPPELGEHQQEVFGELPS
jgi:crotonobetainyl-CoA:carnitine CoA-transferase CaiB-like acyl-CoA transferase